jgi:hypothetical protein
MDFISLMMFLVAHGYWFMDDGNKSKIGPHHWNNTMVLTDGLKGVFSISHRITCPAGTV